MQSRGGGFWSCYRERLVARTLESDSASELLDRLAGEVASRQRDPYSAVEELMQSQSGSESGQLSVVC